jgi:hypothetical protein
MTQEHPINPPPELVQEWLENRKLLKSQPLAHTYLATRAAQWGADQELEACCEEMKSIPSPLGIPFGEMASNALRAARRPKPSSLKEQALEDLDSLIADLANHGMGFKATNIRRALEQLPDNE